MASAYSKKAIFDLALDAVKEIVAETEDQVRYFEQEAAGYPSKMESASDTNRSQQQSMAKAARETAAKFQAALGEMSLMPEGWDKVPHETVQCYSLVKVLASTGSDRDLLVFIVPGKAGKPIEYAADPDAEPVSIMVLAQETPLAEALMSKRPGDTAIVVNTTYTIDWLQ